MANPNAYAILSIDPGGTTGIATALINLAQPTVASAMRRALSKGHINTFNITGPWQDQVFSIQKISKDFWFEVHTVKGWVIVGNYTIAIEKFELRTLAADIIPLQILTGLEILNAGSKPAGDHFLAKQSPSEAMGFCSDEMLQDWDLWKKKSPHERAALKHLAKRIDNLLREMS